MELSALRLRILKIPGDGGFWKPATEDAFIDAADEMRNAGMPDEKIIDILEGLYHTVADEFGD